jgi:hypothetical protein
VSKPLRYSERIFPSLGATSSLLALIASVTFAIWAALGLLIASSFAAIAISFSGIWWFGAIQRIDLGREWLQVNDARVQTQHLGSIEILEPTAWKNECGINFDPTAYHAHRFWDRTGLKVELRDSRDPHTAWVIASRNPSGFAEALTRD